MKKNRIVWLFAVLAAAFALPASAQWTAAGLYFGGSLGRSNAPQACRLGPAPCEKKRDTVFSLFVGYKLNRYLALEAAYNDLGHVTVGGSDIKSRASDIVGVGYLPLTRGGRFALFGKLGAYHGEMKGAGNTQRKNGATVGWGLQYDAGRRAAVRGEWQRFIQMGGGSFPASTHVDVYTLGLLFRLE